MPNRIKNLNVTAKRGLIAGIAAAVALWNAAPAEAFNDCDSPQGFFLRATVENIPLFSCPGLDAAPKSAGLSFDRDNDTGDWVLNVNGGAAFLLTKGKRKPPDGKFSGFIRTETPLAFYVESNGSFGSEKESKGVTRAGLKMDLVFQNAGPSGLDAITVSSALYHQFDFEGASGVGVKATVRPWSLKRKLNAPVKAANRPPTDPYFFWSPFAAIDAFWSDDAGETALSDDQDYAWVEFGSNFTYVVPKFANHGGRFELELSHQTDLNSGLDATLGELRTGLFLNEEQTASLDVTYTKGRNYRSLQKVDKLAVAFGLRF